MLTLGNENLFTDKYRSLWQGKRIGMVTNYTGVNTSYERTVDKLIAHGADVMRLFSPEHGFYGVGRAGEAMDDEIDQKTGIEITSLYGEKKDLDPAFLDDVDVLMLEFQDVGSRFYTYVSTMFRVMKTAQKVGIPLLILDRPNPLGGEDVEGGDVEEAYRSFVGDYSLPIRHGLTLGELATLYQKENQLDLDLHVVLMDGWKRDQLFGDTHLDWVPPSQNIPTFETATLYPGTAFIEGTNLSEGRGTTMPFRWLGAPWINGEKWADALNELDLPGVKFRPVIFQPTFSKHCGETVEGVQIHIVDQNGLVPTEVGLHVIDQAKKMYPNEFQWIKTGDRYFIDLLWGSSKYRQDLDRGRSVSDISREWREFSKRFKERRKPYLLYQ